MLDNKKRKYYLLSKAAILIIFFTILLVLSGFNKDSIYIVWFLFIVFIKLFKMLLIPILIAGVILVVIGYFIITKRKRDYLANNNLAADKDKINLL